MAAFAAVVSLMNTIHLIQNHPRYSFSFDINQISSFSENARIFLQFVESFNNCHGRSKQVENLEIQIAFVACLAENVLTFLAVNQIRAGSALDQVEDRAQIKMKAKKRKAMEEVDAYYSCMFVLEEVQDRMNSIMEEVMKIKSTTREQQSTYSMAASASTRSPTTRETTMVGFDDNLLQLMDVLTGHLSARQIISIVGMGGIGKTTLAKSTYENSVILHHFDVRAWVTISQDYDIKDILLQHLGCNGESTQDTSGELGEKLHKRLWGRRYLIILDDMWSTDVWDRIRFFFPDSDNRSRIVVTTRIKNVSNYLSSSPLQMELLNDQGSWKLFCATTFGVEECPHNLIKIGKNIVRKCRGLPLSIVAIGGHLKKASRMKEEWETVARNMISFLDSGDDPCLSILSLSYTELPACLKPCFLYMGGFAEDAKIDVSTLIRFWVAEGFLQPDGSRSSEEIADNYLKDLVDRNLILVKKQVWKGKILTCGVHDLVREVCLKVGKKERFFCVLKHGGGSSRCKHWKGFSGSRICIAEKQLQLDESRLVELFPNIIEKNKEVFGPHYLEELFDRHMELRYINRDLWWLPIQTCLPSSISLCWNLQTLIIHTFRVTILAPSEIWEMTWLRHLDITH